MNFFVIGFLIMQAARFSVGDELGFPESLGNVEGGRRRSVNFKNGPPPSYVGVLPAAQQVPTQHPLPDKRILSRSTGTSPYTSNALPRQYAPNAPLMTEARPLPLGVPVFRPIPKGATVLGTEQLAERRVAVDTPVPRISVNNKMVEGYSQVVHSNRTYHVANPVVSQPIAVPAFQAMPQSIERLPIAKATSSHSKHPNYLQFEEPKFDLKDVTVEELAAAANVSVDTIKHAIYVREQQMKAEHRAMLAAKLREEFIRTSTTTTTTTTRATTQRPKMIAQQYGRTSNGIEVENKVSKVMNAPKEYYPVGYDKNFDDNFKAKVDLPPTSFTCARQKHFPGLYADVDLGCMVFHVCALTDDGLVRKSFLCPENTLFDQTILKCNWWFYVDCGASKSVYDSNIPISKSYQLMKSLTYFSKLNKRKDSDSADMGLDIQSLKDSMDNTGRNLGSDAVIVVKEDAQDDEEAVPATAAAETEKGDSEETKTDESEAKSEDELNPADQTVQSQDEVQQLSDS